MILQVPGKGQAKTARQGGKCSLGAPLNSLLRSSIHVQRGKRKRAYTTEQVHLPQVN